MDISFYLHEEARRHTLMQPQDIVKFLYQAAFGAEHILEDRVKAREIFDLEYQKATPGNHLELTEYIAPCICRVNLAAWKARALTSEWLFNLFAESAAIKQTDGRARFFAYIKQAESLVRARVFPFTLDQWQNFCAKYIADEPKPVRHSVMYRDNGIPAYRVVSGYYTRLVPILAALSGKKGGIITIDGRAGSGKSTMASLLKNIIGASLIHMDDFFLPGNKRTPERFLEPGGNVDYERFAQEVVTNLSGRDSFSYNVFDCASMDFGPIRFVPRSFWYVVEGAYSSHPKLGEYMDLRVFSDIDKDTQIERIKKRNGEAAAVTFLDRWIPLEESYFDICKTADKAHVLV